MTELRSNISRRDFTALAVAAGVGAGAAGAPAAPVGEIVETDVLVKTPSGMCDAALIHPGTGRWPAVIIFPDIFGARLGKDCCTCMITSSPSRDFILCS